MYILEFFTNKNYLNNDTKLLVTEWVTLWHLNTKSDKVGRKWNCNYTVGRHNRIKFIMRPENPAYDYVTWEQPEVSSVGR